MGFACGDNYLVSVHKVMTNEQTKKKNATNSPPGRGRGWVQLKTCSFFSELADFMNKQLFKLIEK